MPPIRPKLIALQLQYLLIDAPKPFRPWFGLTPAFTASARRFAPSATSISFFSFTNLMIGMIGSLVIGRRSVIYRKAAAALTGEIGPEIRSRRPKVRVVNG